MDFVHSRFDLLHHEEMSIAADLGGMLHQFNFISSFHNSAFIDDVEEGRGVDVEPAEPIEFRGEGASAAVRVGIISEDVDQRWVHLINKLLQFAIEVERIDLVLLLIVFRLQNFHPHFVRIWDFLCEDVKLSCVDGDQGVAGWLVNSGAPPEIWVLEESV